MLCAWYRSKHLACINLFNSLRNPIWIAVLLSDYQFSLRDEEMETGRANVISPRSHNLKMTEK